jgi:hypothetical protein
MRTLYGFSKSVRNPDLRKAKKQLTMLLDETSIKYFKALAEPEREVHLQSAIVVAPP